ncbi:MAG: tRNA adenosine(34) deaminase TadA [Acidobacteria bacterium]|nr:tRNA adenosine(34) deaminase TadA [Acidobacteriota bacterium]
MSADLRDEAFLRRCLQLADAAEAAGEVPVGAVVVRAGEIVGEGFNRPLSSHDPTAHAEIVAMRAAAQALGTPRLDDCDLYVTMEPCAMCAGALVVARIRRLVFGTRDIRFGAVRSKFQIADSDILNHRAQVTEGVLAADCVERLKRFFEQRRGG